MNKKTKKDVSVPSGTVYNEAISFIRKESGNPEEVKKFYGKWERNLARVYIGHLNSNPKEKHSLDGMKVYFEAFTEFSIKEMFKFKQYRETEKKYKKTLPGKIEKAKDGLLQWMAKFDNLNKKCNDPTVKGFENLKNETKKKKAREQIEFWRLKSSNLMKKFLNIQ